MAQITPGGVDAPEGDEMDRSPLAAPELHANLTFQGATTVIGETGMVLNPLGLFSCEKFLQMLFCPKCLMAAIPYVSGGDASIVSCYVLVRRFNHVSRVALPELWTLTEHRVGSHWCISCKNGPSCLPGIKIGTVRCALFKRLYLIPNLLARFMWGARTSRLYRLHGGDPD